MISLLKFFSSQSHLLSSNINRVISPKRGARSVTRIFRTKLPKYKVNTSQVPPLTKLLTSNDEDLKKLGFLEMRREKLEVYKKYIPESSNINLLEALFDKVTVIDELLNIISENLETMTSFYLASSFEALDDMMRAELCHPGTVAVAPEFKHLCKRTLYKIRFFEADEVLKLLKCLSTMKVTEDILLVQAALQMARNLINDFNLDELETLSNSLEKIELVENSKKSLLLAMKVIIPIAKQKQLDGKQFTSLPDSAVSFESG